MDHFKRILAACALFFGVVGVLSCIALIIGSLVVDSKLRMATRSAYADVDDLCSQAKTRVRQIDALVDQAKITTADVKESLTAWTERAAEERLTQELNERFKLDAKTSELTVALAKTDSFAEMSADSMSLVLKVADMANQAGAKIDTQGLESVQQEVRQLRGKISEAVDDVTNLSARLRDEGDVVALRDRLVAAADLAVRVLATLEVIQSGLQRLNDKLGSSQKLVADSEPQLVGWIHLATAIVIFLLLWSVAGQFALGRTGWQAIRK